MSRTEIVLAIATIAVGAALWGSHQVVVDDQAHYIVSGMNLVAGRGFTNPAGLPEIWFPPLYPLLIGLVSMATRDGFAAAKLISLAASVVWMIAVYRTGRSIGYRHAAVIAAGLLILQPDRASFSVLSMSQALFSALLWSALAVHAADPDGRRRRTAPAAGLLFGLAAMTRPEALLPMALVAADRTAASWKPSPVRALRQSAVLLASAALVIAPYVAYLHSETGSISPTGKSELNLAIGRAHDAGEPTFRIDPATHEIALNAGRGGVHDLVRYSRFLQHEVGMLGGMLGLAGVVWLGLGCWLLARHQPVRARVLLWAASPLVVIPFYVPAEGYLAPFLPAIMIPAAIGIAHVWARAHDAGVTAGTRRVAVGALAATMLWTIAADAHTLAHFYVPGREPVAERVAGEWLARTAPREPVAAVGGTIAYYAGMPQRFLTADPLPGVVEYMKTHAIRFIGVGTRDRAVLHPSVAGLLDGGHAEGLRLIFTGASPNGEVCRVYELEHPAAD